MKKCSKCKILKSFSEFWKSNGMKIGLTSRCIVCIKEWRQIHKKRIARHAEKYYSKKKNRDRRNATNKIYRQNNKEKIVVIKREGYYRRKYGLGRTPLRYCWRIARS